MRKKIGTHVYIATSGELAKVGVTRNLERRRGQLRYYRGHRFKLWKAWDHDDPYAIELMVCHALELRKEIGREVFLISAKALEKQVCKAMETYRRQCFRKTTNVSRLKDATYWWMILR